MTIRRCHLVVLLMLPLMLLRGMLPAGYMPVTDNGQWRFAMCGSAAILAGDAAGPEDADRHLPSSATDCPFGHAQAASVLPSFQPLLALLPPAQAVRFISLSAAVLPPTTGPPRTAAPRGPPARS